MKKIVVLFLLFAASASYAGAFFDGARLNQLAASYERFMNNSNPSATDTHEAAMLVGYVVGVQDAHDGIIFCVPSGVSMAQLVAITIKYVREKPKFWNQSGQFMVDGALIDAFPCKK